MREGSGVKSVLVIDDDHELAEVISTVLAHEGFDVRCATSGERGIELASERAPGAVMLDWQMPDLCGQDVLARFSSRAELSGIPLVLMSAHLESIPQTDLARHLHIRKPFELDELVECVNRAVSQGAGFSAVRSQA
jgi:DNA-binding response OmpR family regulator